MKLQYLVPQVYLMCAIGLKFQLSTISPQVLKMSCISPFTNCR